MIRTFARPVGLVVIAVLVAACGGTASTPPGERPSAAGATAGAPVEPGAIPAACTLLTDADIEEMTGTTVVAKDDNVADTVYANHCRWTLTRSDGGNGELDLGILSPGGRERYDHSGGTSGLDPIDGLPADLAGEDTNVGGIFAVRGDTLLDVFSTGLGLSTETEVELMRRALERLGG